MRAVPIDHQQRPLAHRHDGEDEAAKNADSRHTREVSRDEMERVLRRRTEVRRENRRLWNEGTGVPEEKGDQRGGSFSFLSPAVVPCTVSASLQCRQASSSSRLIAFEEKKTKCSSSTCWRKNLRCMYTWISDGPSTLTRACSSLSFHAIYFSLVLNPCNPRGESVGMGVFDQRSTAKIIKNTHYSSSRTFTFRKAEVAMTQWQPAKTRRVGEGIHS